MQLKDSLISSLHSLRTNRMRGFLTMLGIVIGIASTILLMSLGSSAQILILKQIQGVGSNLVFVIPGTTNSGGMSSSAFGIVIKTLVERDMEALRREPSISAVAPVVRGQARLIVENKNKAVTWQASTDEFFAVNNLPLQSGREFSAADVESSNHVIVLGSQIASDLFGDREPTGKTVRLKDVTFRVIGVLAPKGVGALGIDQDQTTIIPMTVGQKQLLGINYYQSVAIQVKDTYEASFVKGRVTAVLRQNHNITDPDKYDFIVRAQEDVLSTIGNITTALSAFLTAIAAISLVVGGIGVMNIMFVSVIERTREIGLRKAVGATQTDIQRQFLVEAVTLTFIGGIVGIVFGALLTALFYVGISRFSGIDWTFSLPPLAIILAAAVSVLTGLVFGVYPARQAARMNPIDALRFE
jgi:putative ABC transport system permease protein